MLLFNSEPLHCLGLEAFNNGSEASLSPLFLFSTSYTSLLNVTQLPPDQQARTNTTPSDERAVLSERVINPLWWHVPNGYVSFVSSGLLITILFAK